VTAAADPPAVGARIEELLEEFERVGDAAGQARAEELVRLLVELYGAALARIAAGVGQAALLRLGDDELVGGLLVLHDLHPLAVETRLERAVDGVRAGLRSGSLELLGLDPEGVLRLRLAADGCASTVAAAREAVERAVAVAAPEVTAVEVEVHRPPTLLQIQRYAVTAG
jgi:Fe-S cluster biogenesis protein NfuA